MKKNILQNYFLKIKIIKSDEIYRKQMIKKLMISEQLFDQDINEEEDFEIPAFLRKQKF